MPFNNAAERALRGFALGKKAWLFAGSDRGAEWAAVTATLIMTARLNTSTRQPGSPTSLHASLTCRKSGCTSCCRGTGRLPVGILHSGGVIMHVNKVHFIITIASRRTSVKTRTGYGTSPTKWIQRTASSGLRVDDESIMVFTGFGIENRMELIRIHKENSALLKR